MLVTEADLQQSLAALSFAQNFTAAAHNFLQGGPASKLLKEPTEFELSQIANSDDLAAAAAQNSSRRADEKRSDPHYNRSSGYENINSDTGSMEPAAAAGHKSSATVKTSAAAAAAAPASAATAAAAAAPAAIQPGPASTAVPQGEVPSESVRVRITFAPSVLRRGEAAAAATGPAASSPHVSRLRQLLADDQSRQTDMEAAADGLEKELNECRRQLAASRATNLQQQMATNAAVDGLENQLAECRRQLADREEKLAAREMEHETALRTAADQLSQQLVDEKRRVAELQQRLTARDADYESLVTTLAEQTESAQKRLVTVKMEKLDADADAVGAAQQRDKAAAAKRKAEADLQEEAKRHRGTADQLEEKEASLSCVACLERPRSVLHLPCGHLTLCDECDADVKARKGACAVCRGKITKRHTGVIVS